jgi:hypothetical protein
VRGRTEAAPGEGRAASKGEAVSGQSTEKGQPTAKPQQTKQQFQESFAKAMAKQPTQPSPKGLGSLAANPAQVTNVWNQAKTSAKSGPDVGQPSKAKGLTTVGLDSNQYAAYQTWTAWAKKYDVPVAKIFTGSPDFATFIGFMGELKKIRESPSLGSSEKDLAKQVAGEVASYLSQHGVSAPNVTWGGSASTATVPKTEEKKKPEPETSTDQPPWATGPFTWTTTTAILDHLKDAQEKHEYPTSVAELEQYVVDHAHEFKRRSGNEWQAPLEGMKTRVKGGGSELKWWSIVLEVTGPGKGRIFHYGPEHLYK